MRIKAYVGYNERTNTHYYRSFEVVDWLPDCKEIREIKPDIEQGREEAWKYNYYECVTEDEFGDEYGEWYAISKFGYKDIVVKGYPANIVVDVRWFSHLTQEYESGSWSMDTDGLEFEDDIELDDYIMNWTNEHMDVWLNEDDESRMWNAMHVLLEHKIIEEEK